MSSGRTAVCGVIVGAVLVAGSPAPAQHEAGPVRFGMTEPPAKADGTIRLATYNLLNLFDDKDDPDLWGRNEDLESVKPESELRALAETIRRVDADVLAVQEVESRDVLLWFRDTYLSGMGYEHMASEARAGDDRGIENAVLSRFPITGTRIWPGEDLGGVHPELYGDQPNWYAGEPIRFRRSPLLVDLRIPRAGGGDYGLTLIVVHHKSGRYSDYWREAEARRIVGIVEEIGAQRPSRNIAVLGDFNAQPDEKSVRVYLDAGMIDADADREVGNSSAVTHASGRTIDLILCNRALAPEVRAETLFILGTPVRAEGADYRSTPAPPGFASDHFPVAVEITPADQ